MEGSDFGQYLRRLRGKYPLLDFETASRLARAYGISALDSTRAEIDYLIDGEFALTAEDILWRRSKWGLHLSEVQCARVSAYVEDRAKSKTST